MAVKQVEQNFENELHKAVHTASGYAHDAKEYAMEQKQNAEGMIREHPWAFVLGAFAGGVIIGTLLSKRN